MFNSVTGSNLELDMFNKELRIACEYNGRQHYEFVPFFHKTKKRFNIQKRRDKLKKQFAESNHYKLVVFKYTEPITYNHVLNKIKIGRAHV